jgi:hypothetical protein
LGKVLKCRNSLAPYGQTCWNHIQAPVAPLRRFVADYFAEQAKLSMEFRSTLLSAARAQLEQRESRAAAEQNKTRAELAALETRERNLRRALGVSQELSDVDLTALVQDLAAVTAELKAKRREAMSTEVDLEPVDSLTDDETVAKLPTILMDLLDTSYEMAEVMRELVPRCVIVPVQAFDSGEIYPRAKFSFRDCSAREEGDDAQDCVEVTADLFDLPVRLALLPEIVRLRLQTPRPTLKEIGIAVGTSYMSVKRALDAARKMEARGLTQPLVELTDKPAYVPRWRDAS